MPVPPTDLSEVARTIVAFVLKVQDHDTGSVSLWRHSPGICKYRTYGLGEVLDEMYLEQVVARWGNRWKYLSATDVRWLPSCWRRVFPDFGRCYSSDTLWSPALFRVMDQKPGCRSQVRMESVTFQRVSCGAYVLYALWAAIWQDVARFHSNCQKISRLWRWTTFGGGTPALKSVRLCLTRLPFLTTGW